MAKKSGSTGEAIAGEVMPKSPLDGLTRPQVRRLGTLVQRTHAINHELEKLQKQLKDAKFTISKNYSKQETDKAVRQTRTWQKSQDKATASLTKLFDGFKDNKPLKTAFERYSALETAAANGDGKAKGLLEEVNADIVIAAARTARSVKVAGDKEPTAAAEAKAVRDSRAAGADRPAAATITKAIRSLKVPSSVKEMLNGISIAKVAKKDQAREEKEAKPSGAARGKRREPNEYQEPAPRELYPASLLARHTIRGKDVVDKRSGDVAFTDNGKDLRTGKKDVSKEIIDAMLDTAASRGWAPLKVFGTQAFKAAVWMEAASRGLDVQGYTPTPQEAAAAAQNRALNGNVNKIAGEAVAGKTLTTKEDRSDEKLPTPPTLEQRRATAFQQATTAREQERAVKAHPELVRAFALVAAFDKALAKPGMSKQDARDFSDQFKELVASRLAEGKRLPTVELRENVQEKQQTQAEDQER